MRFGSSITYAARDKHIYTRANERSLDLRQHRRAAIDVSSDMERVRIRELCDHLTLKFEVIYGVNVGAKFRLGCNNGLSNTVESKSRAAIDVLLFRIFLRALSLLPHTFTKDRALNKAAWSALGLKPRLPFGNWKAKEIRGQYPNLRGGFTSRRETRK